MPDDLLKIQMTSPEDRDPWLRLLIAGPGKVGKTRFASGFPNVFYADAEGRMASVADRRVPYVRITNSDQLVQLRRVMAQSPERRAELIGRPVDTLVIDTIDEVSRILTTERLREVRKDNMSGDDWGWLAEQLRNLTRGFRNLPMHVIFNCHLKDSRNEYTGVTERKPNITGGFGNEVTDYFDQNLVMRAYSRSRVTEVEGEEIVGRDIRRYLQSYPDVGLEWVGDSYGKLPMELEIGLETDEQLRDNFERLMAHVFEGEIPEVRATTQYEEPKPPVEETGDEEGEPTKAAAPVKKAAKKAAATKKTAAKTEPPAAPADEPEATPSAKSDAAGDDPAPPASEPTPPVEQPPAEAPEPETAPAAEPATVVEAAAEPDPEPEPEPQPEPEPEAQEGEEDTAAADNAPLEEGEFVAPACADCGKPVESEDQADLSTIRFRVPLCSPCYRERKTVGQKAS